jgi:hypothetical protein
MGCSNGLAGQSGTWKNIMGKLVIRKFGEVHADFSESAKNMEILVFHVNDHLKVTSAGRF